MNWTHEQEAEANRQGWGLVTIWDDKKQRIECDIASKLPEQVTDEAVQKYVSQLAQQGNKLAMAATQAVFHSRLTPRGTP